MSKTYVTERQVEYWTSREIENSLLDVGYQVVVLPIPQNLEREIPADHVFSGDLKIFGIQYKALYHNGKQDFWRLSKKQHSTLKGFPWIAYGLSEIRSIKQARSSLYALRIKNPSFSFAWTLRLADSSPYMRWWAFFRHLQSCTWGAKVSSLEEVQELLSDAWEQLTDDDQREFCDLFLLDMETPMAVRISMALNPET